MSVRARVDSSRALSRQQQQQQQLDGTIKGRFSATSTGSLCPAQTLHCNGSCSGSPSARSPRGEETFSLLAAAAPPGRGGSRQQAGGASLCWRLPQDGRAWKQRGLFGKCLHEMFSAFIDSFISKLIHFQFKIVVAKTPLPGAESKNWSKVAPK